MFLLYLIWGVVAGYFAGFLGIGAGVLIMPFLTLMGVPYQNAIDVSLMAVFASSVTGSIQHNSIGGINWEPCIAIAIPGAIFAVLGSVYLIHIFPPTILEVLFAGLMFLNVDLLRIAGSIVHINNTSSSASYSVKDNKKYLMQFLFIGAISGLMASLLGIGGGIVIVTLLMVMTNFTLKEAIKSSVIVMVATTFFSLSVDIIGNTLPYDLGIPTAIGAIVGGFLGVIALNYVQNTTIRKINYVISFSLGFLMIFKVLLV